MFLVQTKTTLDLCMIVASCFVAVFLGFSGSWTKLEGIMNSSKFQSVLVQHLWVSVWESGKRINEQLNFIWGYSEAFKIVAGLNRIEHGFECELIRRMSTSVEPCFNVYLSVSVDFLFKVYCWIFFFFFFYTSIYGLTSTQVQILSTLATSAKVSPTLALWGDDLTRTTNVPEQWLDW